jgi:HK97 gp10 family phage protein
MAEMEGMSQFLHRLAQLENVETAKEKALKKGAEYLQDKLKENTPRSPHFNGDHAADNVKIVKNQESGEYMIGFPPQFYYMRFIEYGFNHVGGKKIAPNPFLDNTIINERKATNEIMVKEIKKDLNI